jgi:hypothetical protein
LEHNIKRESSQAEKVIKGSRDIGNRVRLLEEIDLKSSVTQSGIAELGGILDMGSSSTLH